MPPATRWKALALSLVAGLGQLVLRRYALGALLFSLFASALNGVLLSYLWQGDEAAARLRLASFALAALVWLASAAHTAYLVFFCCSETARRRREALIRAAHRHYLLGRLVEARQALESARRLSPEAHDADVLFLLGALARRAGQTRRARRLLRRCRAHDEEGRWRWAVARELEGILKKEVPGPAIRPEPPPTAPLTPEAPENDPRSGRLRHTDAVPGAAGGPT